jgi:transcriptional regulator with XRE-family HTH domain
MTGPDEWRRTIAANIRAERARAGISQDDVARQMRDLGFPAWQRGTVSLAEQAKRRVTCDEAIGLAWILKTNISTLLCAV